MRRHDIKDDLTGLLGAVAGLANDARRSAREKAGRLKDIVEVVKAVERLERRIDTLERRVAALEAGEKTKPQSSGKKS